MVVEDGDVHFADLLTEPVLVSFAGGVPFVLETEVGNISADPDFVTAPRHPDTHGKMVVRAVDCIFLGFTAGILAGNPLAGAVVSPDLPVEEPQRSLPQIEGRVGTVKKTFETPFAVFIRLQKRKKTFGRFGAGGFVLGERIADAVDLLYIGACKCGTQNTFVKILVTV